MPRVTVAIPVRDGAATLEGVLAAVRAQRVERVDGEVEVLVCDSGSRDGSREIAAHHGARVLAIPSARFAHGPTRNLLMAEAGGEYVALLTQDAEPADELWLARLLSAFELAPDVGLAFGPYAPRPGAAPHTARELSRWFASLAPDGAPRVDRLLASERSAGPLELFGRRTFFTDANACVRRAAWERIPFRDLDYAEDQALALDMLRGGYAKVFVPDAPVLHSHDYTSLQQFRRAFDEWRGLAEVYGWREPVDPVRLLAALRGELGADWRELSASGAAGPARAATWAAGVRASVVRRAGAVLGSRADALAPGLAAWCSLERRSGARSDARPAAL